MKFSTFFICLMFIAIINPVAAQNFIHPQPNQALTFKEMQLQFNDWKNNRDISQEKGWKYFKRWEMETQLHTNTNGEPIQPEIFIDEVTRLASEKEILKATNGDRSLTWLPAGPNVLPNNLTGYMENGIGRINCISFDPNSPSTYYVGVAQGGLWKTTNNGTSWLPLTDDLPITRISDIAIDPNNTNTMYISVCDFEYIGISLQLNGRKRNTHYGLGVYKTTNGGQTWTPTGLSFQLTNGDASLIRKTIVNQNNSNKLVACGTSGIYTSNDAGNTWTKTLDSLFWDLTQDPSNPNVLYAASGWVSTSNQGNAAIYKSTDFGASWTMLNTGIPPTGEVQRIRIEVAPSNPNYVYAIAVDIASGYYGMYKSTNAGNTWQFTPAALNILGYDDGFDVGGQGAYDLAFAVNPNDENNLIVGGINVWGSADGGQNFDPASHWTLFYGPTLHGDIHFIKYQPLTGNVFICSDGGIYRTSVVSTQTWIDASNGSPWSTLWTGLNDGMQVTSFYRISSSKNTSGKIMAGAQDNATFFYDGASWNTTNGGDGMDNIFDPSDDNVHIASSQYGNFSKSYDNGNTYNGIFANANNEVAEWTTPIIADYNQPGTMYIGYANVMKSTDNGDSWTPISNFPFNGIAYNEISALAVANTNSNVIYAAKRVRYEYSINGSMYTTNDGGNTWNDVTAGLPDSLYFTSVEVNATNSNTAYVTMAGFSTGNKVFKTTNGGATWQNITYNLPNLPVNCIKSLPNGNSLIAACDVGVYQLDETQNTWVNISVDLPNVIVSDIEINEAANKIYLSTFGRGIWQADLSVVSKVKNTTDNNINLTLFPSINDGNFIITYPDFKNVINAEVFDITGRIVAQVKLDATTSKISLNAAPGKYFIKMQGAKETQVKSFIIQK
jgi:photosystem II stability/assembly factor-like uncharacterized protein